MAQMAEARAALEQYFWLPVVPARPGAARRGHPRRPRRARRYAHRCRQVHLLPGALARAPRPHPRGEPARLGSWATRSAPSRPRARARAISTQPSPCRSRTPCSSVRARAGIRSCTWRPSVWPTSASLAFAQALAAPGGLGIPLVAVDEAHCVSQWGGRTFAPHTSRLRGLSMRFPRAPSWRPLTVHRHRARAYRHVQMLGLRRPETVVTGFDRQNLYFGVEEMGDKAKAAWIRDYACAHPRESGIIYCSTRKAVDALAFELGRELAHRTVSRWGATTRACRPTSAPGTRRRLSTTLCP